MQDTLIFNESKELTIELVGVVGLEITSEAIADKINEAKANGVESVSIVLESLGGDMGKGLAIYSILKNSGLRIKSYLRGGNASAATLIASAANVEDIYMDSTGLYLIHKPMTYVEGNANDLESNKNFLDKWQMSAKKIYTNLGVDAQIIDELMERNGGHGEWLSYDEAKAYGFVGNEWNTQKVFNYTKELFISNNLLTPKKIEMAENTIDEKSLFVKFRNWIKNEEEAEKIEGENEMLKAENEALKLRVSELEAELEALKVVPENMADEDEEDKKVEAEKEKEEEEEIKALRNEIKNLAKVIAEPKPAPTNKVDVNQPTWKNIVNAHKNRLK